MTNADTTDPDRRAGGWLREQFEQFVTGVAETLDLEAGLAEATAYARYEELVRDLAGTLNVEAGLSAIVGTELSPAPGRNRPGYEGENPLPASRALEDIAAEKRLELRGHRTVHRSIQGTQALLAITTTLRICRLLSSARALEAVLVLTPDALDGMLATLASYALPLATALSEGLDCPQPQSVVSLADRTKADLAAASDRARDMHSGLTQALTSLEGSPAHRGELGKARRSSAHCSYLVNRALKFNIDHAIGLIESGSLRSALQRVAVRAAALQMDTYSEASHQALEAELERAVPLAQFSANHYDRVASRLLGLRTHQDLGLSLVQGGLDDFTRSDLSHVILSGMELAGVRWSVWGTVWPPEVNIDLLRADSEESPPGSGVYVIRPGTSTTHSSLV